LIKTLGWEGDERSVGNCKNCLDGDAIKIELELVGVFGEKAV
jgi:hypothetical protein